MQRDKKLQNIGKILSTLLGRTPDIYGLLPDPEGWFSIKNLLQALAETPDLRSIREADLIDICMEKEAALEMGENRIRARSRIFPALPSSAGSLPKILHICIREKAWAHVLDKGLRAATGSFLVFSSDPALSLRMGQRKGLKIVPLEIQVARAVQEGVLFLSHGEVLFCAEEVPAPAIMGPRLPQKSKKNQIKETTGKKAETFMPGSFLLRSEEEKQERKNPKKSKDSWKHNKKRLRKEIRSWKEE